MKVKIVTVQLERLKLFTHQSQKKGPFPFPTTNLHPWGLWACPAGIRIAGSQGPIPCCMWQKTQGKGFISSLLNIAPPKLKGLIWASFVTFFSVWGTQMNRRLGTYWQSQLLYSLRKHGLCHFLWETHSGSYLHTVSLVYIHLTKHANIMYSFDPWGLLIHKQVKAEPWLPNCSNYLKTFLILARATAHIIQPPYLSQKLDKHISVFYISLTGHWLFYLPQAHFNTSALSS